ncbi:MAG: Ig domain-containing protein, partial [Oscillospiraceae bacterium]|nr:Ig domain-containing protein [Oscillospiraceae bacterium]
IYFDNISKGEVVLEITSNTDDLTSLDVALEDAALVTLGDVDVRGGRAWITLVGVRGNDGELLRGEVRGTLVMTADNAEPLEITLGGESGSARLVERKTWDTAMKYVPYLAEYSLDGEYSWLNAEYSVIGELPEGLELDARTGKLSGAPVEPGKFSFEIAATLTYADDDNSSSATITREVGFTVANNTAGNLYMLTDPDYGFYRPIGEDIDGRAYYLDTDELAREIKATLKGECSEFYDLWLDGVKLTRRSDDYKALHGATEIKFDEGALVWLSKDEIHTLVFAYKPNSSDNLKLAAQNLIITSDKSAIEASEARDYYNMYTPAGKLPGELDSGYSKAVSSVRLYAANDTLPAGVKTLVRANTEESKGGIGMDIIIADESGEQLLPNGSVTAKMNLPEFFGDDVYVYFLEDGKYLETSATVRDGQVFFTLDGSKTVIVSQRTIDPNAKSSGNPATGVAVSSAGLVISGVALVMILAGRRKENA